MIEPSLNHHLGTQKFKGAQKFKAAIKAKALELGFSTCAFTLPTAIPKAPARLAAWLEAGAAGDMVWMAETKARRQAPEALWPEVESIIMLSMNYGPQTDPLSGLDHPGAANISVYARGRDYHELIKGRLKQLGSFMAGRHKDIALKVFVDTAPVMEKPLAEAAGLGWQGKHTNLVSRDFGSWLFLAAIFTNFRFEPEIKAQDHCGHCQACLDICPTKAFPAPYQLDARRCISYLTIEHKGHIALEFRRAMRNRVYGCDDCLAVCPWNKFAQASQEAKLQAREDLGELAIADLLRLDEAAFRSFFAGSPIKRIGHERFMRNLLIAAGNSKDPGLLDQVVEKLETSSALIRAMAVWALGELMEADRLKTLYEYWFARETDPTVLQEWSHIFF